MENTNLTYPSLPGDIIYIILSHLPVKSLLRFKLVCKSWFLGISAPDFVKTHLFLSTTDPYLTRHHLILAKKPYVPQLCPPILKLSTCSLYSLLRENLTKSMRHKPVIDTIEGDITRIVGSCNGLVCLTNVENRHVVFWNPSTRKSRRLPTLDIKRVPDDWMLLLRICYGFCFDEFNDDFKVFAIFGRSSKYEVSVYSSKSDSWRLIGDFPFRVVWSDGKFANGAIYWVVEEPVFIISFDIKTEMYRNIMLPKTDYEKETYRDFDTFNNWPSLL